MSVATYAAEEISEVKDGFVRYYSDEEGMKTPKERKLSTFHHTCDVTVTVITFLCKPQGTSTSAMLTLWSSADKLSTQLMISSVELWGPSGTHCVALWILYWILYRI